MNRSIELAAEAGHGFPRPDRWRLRPEAVLALLVGAWLWGGAAPARAALGDILRSEGFIEIPTEYSDIRNAVFIHAEINGHPLRLLVDSGGPATLLPRPLARELGLAAGKPIGNLSGLNGVADAHAEITTARSFRLGGAELLPTPIIVSDVEERLRRGGISYDGVIGWAALKRNNVVFGYNPALFFFHPVAGPSLGIEGAFRKNGYAELQLFPHGSAYYVPLAINGSEARMKLDSGAPYTSVSADFARVHALAERGDMLVGGFDGNHLRAHGIQPATLAVGPLALPPLMIQDMEAKAYRSDPGAPGFDGLLGFDVVGQFYSFLDFGNDRLYLRRAAK